MKSCLFWVAASATLWLAVPALAQNAPPIAAATMSISREEARTIIEAAIAYARDNTQSRMAVVVLDNAGHLVSADRMDGASFHLEKFARGKAFLAVITRQSSQNAADLAKTRPDRYNGIMNMYPGEVYLTGGGEPIAVEGKLVGAVGVAGLPEGVDERAGLAGIAAWTKARQH